MKENESFLAYKDHIDKISPISQQIWEELNTILLSQNLKKDEYIVKEDQIYNKEIFVHQGIVRGFYCSETGDECNVVFYQDNKIVCPWFARTKEGRSNINLQAITQATIFEMDQNALKTLRHKNLELYLYSSLIVKYELEKKTQHEIFLLAKNAMERYRMFNKIYPHLENKISQYHIASFLRITPVSLSRLRKNLTKRFQ
jgi:hypothetical protein